MESVESVLKDSGLPGQSLTSPITFTLAKFRFVIKPLGKMLLPPYKGATLRGGFGYAFKDLVCIKPDRQCESCLIQDRCPYIQIFETPLPKGATIMRKYHRAPHPFVLTPPLDERTEFSEEDELSFDLVLIGRAVDYLPYFIYTFEELGCRGLGRNHNKFRVLRADAFLCDASASQRLPGEEFLKPTTVYEGSTKILKSPVPMISFSDLRSCGVNSSMNGHLPQVTLNFLTPVRIWTHGKLDHELNFTDFMKALLRRVQLLQFFHCLSPTAPVEEGRGWLELSEIRRLLKLSESVKTTKAHLRFNGLTRFSTRQHRHTAMGGFTGELTFTFQSEAACGEFGSYLYLGSLVHVGKGTSFGLGKNEVKTLV